MSKRPRETTESSAACDKCLYGTIFAFCPNTGLSHAQYGGPDAKVAVPPPDPHHFVVGDIVWVKIKAHPWWPGEVVEHLTKQPPSMVSVRLMNPPKAYAATPELALITTHNKFVRFFDQVDEVKALSDLCEQKLERETHDVSAYEEAFHAAAQHANSLVRTILNPNFSKSLSVRPVGVVHSFYRSHYAAPRQPNVRKGEEMSDGVIVVRQGLENLCRDLIGFERIWILFQFNYASGVHGQRTESEKDSKSEAGKYKGMVIPPRDTQQRGVFATRSPHRPNPIGLSCVRLVDVHGHKIFIRDHDLLHGTPVLDIKPYLPYCDSHPLSRAGWVDELERSGKAKDDHRWNQREYTVHRVTEGGKTAHE